MTQADPSQHADAASERGQSARVVVIFILITLAVLAVDLISKQVAFDNLPEQPVKLTIENSTNHSLFRHAPATVIPKVLNLQLTTNTGAVFGLGKGAQLFFIVISLLAIILISYFFWSSPRKAWFYQTSLALILGGALGNLYDRICFNAVRDLLHLFPGVKIPFGLHWPGGSDELYPWIFNIADVALVGGVIALIIVSWKSAMLHQQAAQKDSD